MISPRSTIALALFGLAAACAARADDAAVQRCRPITDAAQRLACYDAIVLRLGAAAPAVPATPAAAAAPARTADTFGFERRAPGAEPDAIESSVAGNTVDWRPNQRIDLANGHVWQISDDSNGVFGTRNAKVKVRRGLFGAFFLDIEGSNRSPRVRRVQ